MSVHVINMRNILVTNFIKKKKAAVSLLFLLTDMSIYNILKLFQLHINNVIADINNIYAYYSLFILFRISTLFTKVYLKFVLAIEATVIIDNDLNYYKCTNNSSHFCNIYYNIIVKKLIPKLRSANYINVLSCQKYLNNFSDLTLIKDIFIVCIHPVISIIKLRFNRTGLIVFYHWI